MSLRVASEDFWGCELKSSTTEYTWPCPEDDEFEHKLFLCHASLGVNAKEGERNVVEVLCEDEDSDVPSSHCIVSLKLGLNETCQMNLGFTSAVTFKLVSGSGPVHLVGSHLAGMYEGEELESDDEAVENGVLGNVELESDEESDKEVEKENFMVAKKKVPMVKTKEKVKSSDDEDDSDDNEEDEDDDSDEDESEDSDNGIEEVKKASAGNVSQAKKGVLKSKNVKQDKVEKKVSFDLEKKKSAETLDVNALKAKLEKLQNLPKTKEKFQNFLKSGYKVTDDKLVNQVWAWLSKNRK